VTEKRPAKLLFSVVVAVLVCCVSRSDDLEKLILQQSVLTRAYS